MLTVRRSDERGLAHHGWLKSRHTFSFAEYHDPRHMGFGTLRVINEDWIQARKGFGAHPHRDMEIITYVVRGSLEHRDSLGSTAVIRPSEVQRMSAGTGIIHSEMNPEESQETHLFQIWIKPQRLGLTPGYGQKSFADQLNDNKLVLVVSADGRDGSIPINQDVDLYIRRFNEAGSESFQLRPGRSAWLQVVAGSVAVAGQALQAGDALAIQDEPSLVVSAGQGAEILLFELKTA